MEKLTRYLHLIIAGMLVLCLLPMPYGFFNLVRLVAAAAFAWWAYCYYKKAKDGVDGHIHCAGDALPAVCQSCIGTRSVESGGYGCGCIPRLDLVAREEDKQEISNTRYYDKEIDTYSRAYLFLEKGTGHYTGKTKD